MAGSEKIPNTGVEVKVMQAEDWLLKWEKQDVGFHLPNVNEMLEKHIDRLLDGREGSRIFVPLCGKTLDMKWLADKGHTVVGVELSEEAIKAFFEEQKLEYTSEKVENFDGEIFKSQDGRIRLYRGNLFAFNKDLEGQFDGIWDRGSFVAINRDCQEKYMELTTSLMNKDCIHLMDVLHFDQSKYPGPPYSVQTDEIRRLFGGKCTVEEIDSVDGFQERHIKWGIDTLNEITIVLKLK